MNTEESKNEDVKKESELSPEDLERAELLRKAGEKTGRQLRIDLSVGSLHRNR